MTHGRDIRGHGCLGIPFGQHVEHSAPSFRIDAGVRISMDGASNSGHQILGCVYPVTCTQRVDELLQVNPPYFREPGFVPVNLGIGVNE